jgi:hypothetical protein
MTLSTFGYLGGSPSGYATARMGMYYDRAWRREEFCKRLAPNVAPDEWKSLWTPLGGTGIVQKNMLYVQGSNLATTDKFVRGSGRWRQSNEVDERWTLAAKGWSS